MNSLHHIVSPLDQLKVTDLLSLNAPILGNLSLSFTNVGLYLTLAGCLTFTISLACLVAKSLTGQFYPTQSVNADSTLGEAHGLARPELAVEVKPKKRDYKDKRAWANPLWADVPRHVNPSNKEEEVAFFDLRHRNGESLKRLFAPIAQHRSCYLNIDGRDV